MWTEREQVPLAGTRRAQHRCSGELLASVHLPGPGRTSVSLSVCPLEPRTGAEKTTVSPLHVNLLVNFQRRERVLPRHQRALPLRLHTLACGHFSLALPPLT